MTIVVKSFKMLQESIHSLRVIKLWQVSSSFSSFALVPQGARSKQVILVCLQPQPEALLLRVVLVLELDRYHTESDPVVHGSAERPQHHRLARQHHRLDHSSLFHLYYYRRKEL